MTLMPDKLLNVVQGEYRISSDPTLVLTTVLGSCVAVCLYDARMKIGGMNHFLLPHGENGGAVSMRYGAQAMELLINGLLKQGVQRDDLRAKIFGGARMTDSFRDIGASNAAFARQFLSDENVPITGESLGGRAARRLRFWPTSGHVKQLLVENPPDLPAVPVAPTLPAAANDITLF